MDTTPPNNAHDASQENQPGADGFTKLFQTFLLLPETTHWSRLFRRILSFNKIWDDIFQTLITITIAIGVVITLVYVQREELIDKSTFGVMFGTVIGYVLSWRFGK